MVKLHSLQFYSLSWYKLSLNKKKLRTEKIRDDNYTNNECENILFYSMLKPDIISNLLFHIKNSVKISEE